MKFWKRKAALLLTAVMLSGSLGQTAVIASEPDTESEAEAVTEAEEPETDDAKTQTEAGEPETGAAETQTEAEESEPEEEPAEAIENENEQETETSEEEAAQEAEIVNEDAGYSGRPTDSQPRIASDTKSLTLVKGQKFVLSDDSWTSSDKKILSVSKTKAKAKKAGTVKLSNGSQTIDVTVVAPFFEKKTVKMTAGEEREIPLNNTAGLTVYYDSLNNNVAGAYGINSSIIALGKGSAVINAYVNGVQFKYTVKVADVDTTKKDFTNTVDLKPMQSVNIKLSGFKASKAVWKSDTMVSANEVPKGYVFEDAVVRINKKGRITAIGEGTTELTASGGSTEPVKITIHVYGPSTKMMHIYAGDTKPLKLYGVKGNVDWKPQIEGDELVKVEKNKVKAGTTPGITTLDAEVEGFKYTAVIFVMDATIRNEGVSKKGNKYTLEMNSGSTLQLAYMAVYQNVILKSSDCSVAYADENCIIHARKKGSAKLSGKINGKAITVTVKVEGND